MDDDYKRFCLKCSWNDADFGCTSPRGEELWQCPMYIHYHPEEVKEFEQDMEEELHERELERKIREAEAVIKLGEAMRRTHTTSTKRMVWNDETNRQNHQNSYQL